MPRWLVDAAHAGMRLDRFVTSKVPEGAVTNGLLQRFIRRRQMLYVRDAAGAAVRARDGGHRLAEGDQVDLHDDALNVHARDLHDRPSMPAPTPLTSADIAYIRSLVIHRDPSLIAVNKPSGLATQGGTHVRRHLDGLLGGLLDDIAAGIEQERPRLVHRLDKDTSGIVLLGRTRGSAAKLSEMLRTPGMVQKEYLAFLTRAPRAQSGVVDRPLMQAAADDDEDFELTRVAQFAIDPSLGIERAPLPKIQTAVTHYRVLHDLKSNGALVRLTPETGRKHQLRVHCAAALEAPMLGDRKYGHRETPEGLRGLLGGGRLPLHLHMRRVVLRDWDGKGKDLVVEAPLPQYFADTLNKLGINLKVALSSR